MSAARRHLSVSERAGAVATFVLLMTYELARWHRQYRRRVVTRCGDAGPPKPEGAQAGRSWSTTPPEPSVGSRSRLAVMTSMTSSKRAVYVVHDRTTDANPGILATAYESTEKAIADLNGFRAQQPDNPGPLTWSTGPGWAEGRD